MLSPAYALEGSLWQSPVVLEVSQNIQLPWLRPRSGGRALEGDVSPRTSSWACKNHDLLRWSRKGMDNDSSQQVNYSPSFTTDSHLDREVKDALLCDTMTLVNLQGVTKER